MQLLTPRKVKERLPLSSSHRKFVQKSREMAKDLVSGKDGRLAIVMGPCSIHNLSSALEYGRRLRQLAEEIASASACIMRVYIEKPRTVTGWKGLVYDPHLDGSNDIQTGIFWARELFLTLTDMGIPIATEILNPLLLPYFDDLITWGFVGARTSASQPHREIASLMPFPIGFKNSPDGNIEQAIQAMVAASTPHRFPHVSQEGSLTIVESEGNPLTHIVLRGGKSHRNYDPKSIAESVEMLQAYGLKNRILVDCSHGNCQKEYSRQKEVFCSVLEQFENGNRKILGMMLESHLEEGYQYPSESPSSLQYAVSITDPCLGWSETEALIRKCTKPDLKHLAKMQ